MLGQIYPGIVKVATLGSFNVSLGQDSHIGYATIVQDRTVKNKKKPISCFHYWLHEKWIKVEPNSGNSELTQLISEPL